MADFIIEGRYKLVCKIGSGSFGDCYKATDLREGKEVAVKMEAMNVSSSFIPLIVFQS
jgi:casein kinase 1, alpha